jgi:selenocysteine-specific elongation factor
MVLTATRHVIVGTAGHIDHGKTRLVGRLTGIDTDRLPEEKARGISIDLGFAHWQADGVEFGVVDVPGHQRFVKNMVAGATGVNLALLVVAADDGVMPQTREHLEIMDLLGVNAGVVALTKIDLIEPELIELAADEIADAISGTFLEGCPIVPVSSVTGAGIDELKETLARVAAGVEWPDAPELFRLPIDRVFSVPGYGTVVTGSALGGTVHAGDVLELVPDRAAEGTNRRTISRRTGSPAVHQGRAVRVRGVQKHGLPADDSGSRQRTAVNLAGVKTEEIARGQELATPGYLVPARRLLVQLRSLGSSPLVLKDRMELNLHLGTAETPARVVLKGRPLRPGETAYAELRLKQPVVATHGQRFILRRISPALTVAGGTILDPSIPPALRLKDLDAYAAAFDSPVDSDRLSFLLSQRDVVDDAPLEAARRAGIPSFRYPGLVEELKASGVLVSVAEDRPLIVHRDRLAALANAVMRAIRDELARQQPRRALPRTTLLAACRRIAQSDLVEAVFAELLNRGDLVRVGENFGPADIQVQLTKAQQQARTQILASIGAGGLGPPTTKELAAAIGQPLEQLEPLLRLAVEDGLLFKVSENLYFTPATLERGRAMCENLLQAGGTATVSQLREAWGVSRKFSVPLCEYFDARGVTTRDGDLRTAGPNLGKKLLS